MSNRRDRLGRGLGALLGDYLTDASGPSLTPSRNIPIAAIAPNPFQPRREFTEADLADLTTSIRENGLLQPILVRPKPGEGVIQWELVAGERRWRACTRLGWKEIPAAIRDVDDRTLLVLAMVENLQRAGLSPLEEAEGYRRLGEEFSLTHSQVADLVGKDRSTVSNSLRLLSLPVSVRRLVEEGSLTAGHARALLGLTDTRRMAELGRMAAEEGWSVREIEGRVQKHRSPSKRKPPRAAGERDATERRLEEELQRILGTAVKLKTGRGATGRIEIPFYGAEDFERVFELVTGKTTADVVS